MVSRRLTHAALACALVLAGCTGGAGREQEEPPPRPNILVILTDDQRIGTLDVLPVTRRIFAEGGTTFTNAFATTPQCCPSRASILSGQYAHNHGVEDNSDALGFDHDHTIQRYLGDAGYRTAITGKYINYQGSYYDEKNVGRNPPHWDRWASFLGGYEDPMVNVNGDVRVVPTYTTTFVRDHAVDYIRSFERNDDDPWFLYVAPFAPHPPSDPEERYRASGVPKPGNEIIEESDRSDKPPYVQESGVEARDQRVNRRRQLRTLRSVDDLVRKLFTTLRETGEERDTLAIFMSDNGFMWGDHGLAGKGTPYTHSVGIPLLIRWSGHIDAGATDERLVGNLDVPFTILDALKLTPPDLLTMDGRSLLSADERSRILLEHPSGALSGRTIPPWASIRSDDYQYVEYYDGDNVIFREYYDLNRDPRQLNNVLADDDPNNDPNVTALSRLLAQDRACVGPACP